MKQIKNLHLIPESFSPDAIEKMEYAARQHKQFGNLTFKIIEYSPKKVTIKVTQERNGAKVYHTAKRLAEIVHETYGRFFTGAKIIVHTDPFVDTPVSAVDAGWINKKMLNTGTKLKDIAKDTGISYTWLSEVSTGTEQLSQVMKAFFYYYFKTKE